jgi:hypothetical protein
MAEGIAAASPLQQVEAAIRDVPFGNYGLDDVETEAGGEL